MLVAAPIKNLSGLERIFSQQISGEEELPEKKKKRKGKSKFDIRNPEHKAKRDQLMKTYKGDQQKVREILLREFEE